MDFKFIIANQISENIDSLSTFDILEMLEVPSNKELGDFAFPCFKLSKEYRKSPVIIAEELSKKITVVDELEKIEHKNGYVNFYINRELFLKSVINEVLIKKDEYGKTSDGEGKTIVIDFSAPNIAKPFHIGHIRSTVIGNSLSKIYKSQGYNVFRINYLGDYGTQFGKLIVAFKMWGNKNDVELNPIPELLKLYVKFHEEAKKDDSLNNDARMWFSKLENGDKEAYDLWKWFREESLKEFDRVYKLMDIEFDSYNGESFYSDKMDRVVDIIKDEELLVKSQGSNVVDLSEFNLPPALITKQDGSTLYLTRDLASALYRKENYNFYKALYVVANQQELHFKQLFSVLDKIGYEWSKDMLHVPFGMVSLEDGIISTRNGKVVFLEDVLNQAIEKTKETMLEKKSNLNNIDIIAKEVGVGAVVFKELSSNRIKDYVFSLDRILSFDGETGPYVQYTHARCCSLLRKFNENINLDIDYKLLCDEDSFNIIRLISSFNSIVQLALRKNEPHIITRYVLDLSKAFNKFYHDNQILSDDKSMTNARMALVNSTKICIKNALLLLGIKSPEKM